ncbi:MAG: hypothetical protein ABIN24_01990 [Dyadobacter sp.]
MKALNDSLSLKVKNFIHPQASVFMDGEDTAGVPDLFTAQTLASVRLYFEQLLQDGCPQYIAEELCLNQICEPFSPLKNDLLYTVMDREFSRVLENWKHKNIQGFEIENLALACWPVLDRIEQSHQPEESQQIYNRLTGFIYKYLRETRQLSSKELAAFA